MADIERLTGEDVGQSSSIKEVAGASFIGTAIEWYDFFIYATAAALVFGELFFPTFDPLVGTLLSFSTFVVAFVARPIGGVAFGHFGDRLGRKSMLIITLTLMGVATFLIGLLPTYTAIGVWAPILLVALRFLQGIALGGEWGGAVLMAVEHAPQGRRGFYGSWVQIGVPVGLLLSNLVFFLVSTPLSQEQFLAWGWRVPFLLSIILVAVGLFIRLRIMESPGFRRVKETNTEARVPVLDAIRNHSKPILLAAVAALVTGVVFYTTTVFGLSYATEQLGVARNTILAITMISMVVVFFALPAFGTLSDKLGRKLVFLSGAAGMGIMAFPWLWLLNTSVFGLMLLGYLLIIIPFSAAYGALATFFAELFDLRVRYSGLSVAYTLSNLFGAGLAPIISTSLLIRTGTGASVAWYLVVTAVMSFVSVVLLSETYQKDIEEDLGQVHQPPATGGVQKT
jgi:MHS family shikimate/dehydroshikimate transporter-like MFS transporter